MEMQFGDHSYQEQAYDFINITVPINPLKFVMKTVMGVLKRRGRGHQQNTGRSK